MQESVFCLFFKVEIKLGQIKVFVRLFCVTIFSVFEVQMYERCLFVFFGLFFNFLPESGIGCHLWQMCVVACSISSVYRCRCIVATHHTLRRTAQLTDASSCVDREIRKYRKHTGTSARQYITAPEAVLKIQARKK